MDTGPDLAGMADGMHQFVEIIKVAMDAADGIRAELTNRGYSPAQAESVAVEFLRGAVRMCMPGSR